MTLTLDAIRDCLDGAVPGVIATCASDGTPNISYVSQIFYLDRRHVALSFQFFNKTYDNARANPRVCFCVRHPTTAASYAVDATYLRTETEGPLFEQMRARLASIASHSGMSDIFVLRGADVYRVDAITLLSGEARVPIAARNPAAAMRAMASRIARHDHLEVLFDATLAALFEELDVEHAMILMWDHVRQVLYTVASRGYASSGVGAEVPLGEGVIGLAARERVPIRLTHLAAEYAYAQNVRTRAGTATDAGARDIEFVGLVSPESQLAVPIAHQDRLVGVLFVESARERRFGYDDEDALVALATHLGAAITQCAEPSDMDEPGIVVSPSDSGYGGADQAPARVRYYPEDDSVFVDGDYLIKGLAGAVLWAMLSDQEASGRVDFTNRELRLDPRFRLPSMSDNLEARLVLLRRRLDERCDFIRLEKVGRGRLRLAVTRPLELVSIAR